MTSNQLKKAARWLWLLGAALLITGFALLDLKLIVAGIVSFAISIITLALPDSNETPS